MRAIIIILLFLKSISIFSQEPNLFNLNFYKGVIIDRASVQSNALTDFNEINTILKNSLIAKDLHVYSKFDYNLPNMDKCDLLICTYSSTNDKKATIEINFSDCQTRIVYSIHYVSSYSNSSQKNIVKAMKDALKVFDNFTYRYNDAMSLKYNSSPNDKNLKNVEVNKKDKKMESFIPSDVDINIPETGSKKDNTFCLIIGNEDYSSYQTGISSEVNVQFAEKDAKIFNEYCIKTLGIPEKNIQILINATGSKMKQNLDLLSKLADANGGNAELIFYYAGHGLPDEKSKEPYLIPVDVSGTDLTYAVKLMDVYKKLTEKPVKKVTVFLDACFSGGARNESLLALRGVKVSPIEEVIGNNIVVFSSSSGEESSAPYKEKQHGLFTYFLLKKLQETKGNITYKNLSDYLTKEIKVNSLLINKKQQTPQTVGSSNIQQVWGNWKLK